MCQYISRLNNDGSTNHCHPWIQEVCPRQWRGKTTAQIISPFLGFAPICSGQIRPYVRLFTKTHELAHWSHMLLFCLGLAQGYFIFSQLLNWHWQVKQPITWRIKYHIPMRNNCLLGSLNDIYIYIWYLIWHNIKWYYIYIIYDEYNDIYILISFRLRKRQYYAHMSCHRYAFKVLTELFLVCVAVTSLETDTRSTLVCNCNLAITAWFVVQLRA